MRSTVQRDSRRLIKGIRVAVLALGCWWLGAAPLWANTPSEESRGFYDKAVDHADRGDIRSAMIELKNALQRDPENAEARLLLGRMHLLLGDGDSAEKELKAAERYGSPPETTLVHMGRAMLLQRRFEELLKAPVPEDQNPEIVYELLLIRAEAFAGLEQTQRARGAYQKAFEQNPSDPRVYVGLAGLDMAERKFELVEERVVAALALDPNMVEASVLRAEALRLKGDPEASVPVYRSILDSERQEAVASVRAHLGLAAALLALGNDEEAEAEVLAARALAPFYPLTSYVHALVKVRGGDFEGAKEILDAAAPTLESFAPAQFLFGFVYYNQGRLQTARTWFYKHLAAHSANLQARKLLASTLLGLGAATEAIDVLESGLEQAPEDPQLLLLMGNAHLRNNQPDKASEFLHNAADHAPGDPQVLGQLAISQLAMGRNEEALAVLDTTLDLGTDNAGLGFVLAFVHLRSGAFDEALRVAQRLQESFADSPLAPNLQGGAYVGLGRFDEAQAAFTAALEIDPDFHEARANLAALLGRTGDLKQAETEYKTILEADQNNVTALVGLAAVARRGGDTAGSRRLLETAVMTDPRAFGPLRALVEDHMAAGEAEQALQVLADAVRRNPDSAQMLSELGRIQVQAGRAKEAVRTYERLVDATQSASPANLLLARAHMAQGETEKARGILERSFDANPEHLPTLETLIQLVLRTEGSEQALSYAERIWRRHPNATWGNQMVGDLHLQANRLGEAMAAYKRGWREQPTGRIAIGLYRARLQRDRSPPVVSNTPFTPVDEVPPLVSLQDWLTMEPGDDGVRMVLAEALLGLGRLEEAQTEYEALKERQASNPIVWNNLAWLYSQAGDARAVAHGERALALAPDSPAIKDTLGWILLEQGETARALALLREAHEAIPDNPEIAFHYAVGLHRDGQGAAAKSLLQSLLAKGQSFPGSAEAKDLLNRIAQ